MNQSMNEEVQNDLAGFVIAMMCVIANRMMCDDRQHQKKDTFCHKMRIRWMMTSAVTIEGQTKKYDRQTGVLN